MSDLQKIADNLSSLTIMQAAELVKVLEEKWGVSAAVPMAAAFGGAAPAADAGVVAAKTSFDVKLITANDKTIPVIKVVKDMLGLDLKAAKDFVSSAPVVVKAGVNKDEAEDIKKKLEEAGAKIEII